MSDLADIAAAAGIAIVDAPYDGGDMGHNDNPDLSNTTTPAVVPDGSGDTGLVLEPEIFDTLFSDRYTEEDPDYVKTLAESDVNSHPPCVEAYFGRRQRGNQSWQRDRNYRNQHHDDRGHRGRGDFHHHGHWSQNRSHDSRDRQRYGDNQNRDRYYRSRSPK